MSQDINIIHYRSKEVRTRYNQAFYFHYKSNYFKQFWNGKRLNHY